MPAANLYKVEGLSFSFLKIQFSFKHLKLLWLLSLQVNSYLLLLDKKKVMHQKKKKNSTYNESDRGAAASVFKTDNSVKKHMQTM